MPRQFLIKTIYLGLLAALTATPVIAAPNPPSATTAENLLDRPKWLPEPPKINTGGFSTDSTLYNEMRRRVLEKKDKTAVPELQKLAKKGHINSIVLLGYLSDNDLKVMPLNSNTAAKYWAIAAKAGDGVALYNLGILYLNGRGVPLNIATATRLFQLASTTIPRSNYLLGQLLEKSGDYNNAIQTYKKCLGLRTIPQCKTRHAILSVTRTRLSPTDASTVINQLNEAGLFGDLEAFYTLARLSAEGIVLDKNLGAMVFYLEAMVNFPNSTIAYKKLALEMYKTYNPTDAEIKRGKQNYRVGYEGVAYSKIKPMINVKKSILDPDVY